MMLQHNISANQAPDLRVPSDMPQSLNSAAARPAPGALLVKASGVGVCRDGRWLIRDVNLEVHKREIVTLIGPNGSGKSTCTKALLGLMRADSGTITRADTLRIGYVPQKLAIDRTLPLTVRRLMTLTGNFPPEQVEDALEQVGISNLAEAPVHQLSGGEFQRALLARAMIRTPDLLVLDEPVQGVDFAGEIALYELIRQARDQLGCGILLISHDLHFVMAETDKVVCLNGHICCEGSPRAVAQDPEYRRLFGPKAAEAFAVYRHEHDHAHDADGSIIAHDHKDHTGHRAASADGTPDAG